MKEEPFRFDKKDLAKFLTECELENDWSKVTFLISMLCVEIERLKSEDSKRKT